MLVDLGGGTLPHPRADVVIDLHHPTNSPAQDAAITPWTVIRRASWPMSSRGTHFDDDSVDEVYSSHFMEHIHRGQPLINVMNEAWRILKPSGTYTMIMPLVGYTDPFTGGPMSNQIGWQPWADPTHVNYWWFPEALYYFCQGAFAPHADYGMKTWAPMGSWISQEDATERINYQVRNQQKHESWWSVRDSWEGVACLVKP